MKIINRSITVVDIIESRLFSDEGVFFDFFLVPHLLLSCG